MKVLGCDIKSFYHDKNFAYLTEHDVDDDDLESSGKDIFFSQLFIFFHFSPCLSTF